MRELKKQFTNKFSMCLCFYILVIFFSCESRHSIKPILEVSENGRYLKYQNGAPFFWLGGTSWGMSEWLSREEINIYLDDRKEKEFNLVQICVFWGKREDNPTSFTLNPPNAYGFKAFEEENGIANTFKPNVVEGGTSENPNDYWDHVEYIIQEADKRNMIVALLPVWGRRYVNAIHKPYSEPVFSIESMNSYGAFLGSLLRKYDNLIWVLGGDVQADAGGNYLTYYRSMAEGIIYGITQEKIRWDEDSPLWDKALITYHPDGNPSKNSSTWFHKDQWLDFNMIETYEFKDSVYKAVSNDYNLNNPIKPTVMGEPSYEGIMPGKPTRGIDMRRQAFQSFFAGAAGFTYGGKFDEEGNGPLWSPFHGWKKMLDMEGAKTMRYVKLFCMNQNWPNWTPDNSILAGEEEKGALQPVAVRNNFVNEFYIYFPENRSISVDLSEEKIVNISVQWFNPYSGDYTAKDRIKPLNVPFEIKPPEAWLDALCILKIEN